MSKPTIWSRMINRLTHSEVERRVRLALSERDGFYERPGSAERRERYDYDREEVLRQALEAWRTNPLARRIVELTSQYVVGAGISLESTHPGTHRFLEAWWNHRLNQMPVRCFELCDELTRAGELFLLLSTDAAGMTYVRALPAGRIAEIRTAENDLEQETAYVEKPCGLAAEGRAWPAYDPNGDEPGEQGRFPVAMLHYAVNRPAGTVHGESDLAPLLRWLSRYSAWLEDRARLNRFRQTFLFVVKSRFTGEAERAARQAALTANPPTPGSILVTDDSETWDVISPKLEAHEAGEDGLALKKMIASGSGVPLHFLAEPESATRTTAESAGGPTFRRFEQRQEYFLWLIGDLARAALRRRAQVDPSVRAEAPISVRGADISGRDNATLAVAAATIAGAFATLRDRGLIDDNELLRVVYRFSGEVADVEALLRRGRAAGRLVGAPAFPGRPAGVKVDPVSGEVKN